jgi:N-sulfoglucosamine sulfohydrolase
MKNTDRPNIVLLQGEDVGRHLGCYGDPVARTPNLDALAAQGTRYDQAFTHAPVCAPSRGGMVTGKYAYSLGNQHMRSTLAHAPRIFTQELRDAGYVVNWHTKLDFNFDPQDGWRDSSEPWHEKSPPDQPFFLYENFHVTHESSMFPEIPEWQGPPPPEAAHTPRHRPEDMQPPPWLTDCPELREQLVRYYNAFSVIDAQIGRRLAWLEEQGLADNTIVMFLSDHGRGLPREKRWCYDAGVHLPLIIRWPEHLKPGSVSHDPVAWVDIAPTILSLAGAAIPADYQGRIFLGPDKSAPRDTCFGGRDRMDEVYDRVRFARTKDWHYIRNFTPHLPWAQTQTYMENQKIMGVMRNQWAHGTLTESTRTFFQPQKPGEELYDAVNDPDCMNNLAGDPAYQGILSGMRARLDTHLREVNDLGEMSEEDMIEEDILTDTLKEYRERAAPLPPPLQMNPFPFPVTLKEYRKLISR